jgi:sulfatase maturation enzyme AslB (radical SAM superfamily)
VKHDLVYLILTPDCNLSCQYCFQRTGNFRQRNRGVSSGEKKGKRRYISEGVVDAFVQYCVSAGVKRMTIFGGEPLLCGDMFERVIRKFRSESPGTELGLTTNGTLLTERIMALLEAKQVSVLLSLDGPKARHDAMRGGFDRIAGWFPRLAKLGKVTVALQAGTISGLYDSVRYTWKLGFCSGVAINIIQNYGWYTPEDVQLFELEYERCLEGMLRGEGRLLCAEHVHRMLEDTSSIQQCGITSSGLACDWCGTLYPCHRAQQLGPEFAIGDVHGGLDERCSDRLRSRIRKATLASESARKYPLVTYCPVATYQQHGRFDGVWAAEYCAMIELKAKLVSKYHYELVEYFRTGKAI